jgi:hypothetical protein
LSIAVSDEKRGAIYTECAERNSENTENTPKIFNLCAPGGFLGDLCVEALIAST